MIIESYIHAPVLLNLLNSLPKRDKMLGKPHILSLFPNMFNEFNKQEHTCKILYITLGPFLFSRVSNSHQWRPFANWEASIGMYKGVFVINGDPADSFINMKVNLKIELQ